MARVLLVDDKPEILDSFGFHFREVAGWNVTLARDGKEAIAILDQQRTALDGVILDKNMPGATGDEVVRWMFEQDLLQDICVVLLTGFPDLSSAIDTLRMGVWQYLIKGDMKPSDVRTFIAPGIAQKLVHRERRAMWQGSDLRSSLTAIERIVQATVAPDGFHVFFLSSKLAVARDLADGSELQFERREFVKRILSGERFVSASTRAEARDLQTTLPDAGALVAVPVRLDHEVLGVMAMESRREAAFDPRWVEVLAYMAEVLSTVELMRRVTEARLQGLQEALLMTHLELRHSVKNSLGIIGQAARDLRRESLSEEGMERVSFIEGHQKRIIGVLEELESIVEPRPLHPTQLDLCKLVRQVAREVGGDLPGDIRLDLAPSKAEVCVTADEAALHDALICVAQNAREAVEARRNYDAVGAESDEESADTATAVPARSQYVIRFEVIHNDGKGEVCIRDDGVGFKESAREKLFNPLYSTKRQAGASSGRGMGLYTARRVITEMGGTIDGNSPGPYRGATFVIVLPACS